MSSEAKLILKCSARVERWEEQERGDYDLDRFHEEFRKRLYSERGRKILLSQNPPLSGQDHEPGQ